MPEESTASGFAWIRANWNELPVNEWAAIDGQRQRVVASSRTCEGLMGEIGGRLRDGAVLVLVLRAENTPFSFVERVN